MSGLTTPSAAALEERGPIGAAPRRVKVRERGFKLLLWLCLATCALLLGTLLVDIGVNGIGQLSASFITDYSSYVAANAGVRAALLGTLWLMVVCAAFIIPIGVATAIYLEEYADETRWWNRAIEVNIQNLAAVPSIVYGILGLAFLVRGPLSLGNVVLAGGLTLGLLVLPVVIIAGREAIFELERVNVAYGGKPAVRDIKVAASQKACREQTARTAFVEVARVVEEKNGIALASMLQTGSRG